MKRRFLSLFSKFFEKSFRGRWKPPPSSLRDATAPNRGGLGKTIRLHEMPRAPLLAGAVAARRLGGSAQATAAGEPHRHPFGMPPVRVAAPSVHIVQSTRVLLAAAPTTPPCFRHWRRSSLLPSRGGLGKEVRLYEMPRAPLLGGLSPQVTGGFSRKLLKSNPTVIASQCHRP